MISFPKLMADSPVPSWEFSTAITQDRHGAYLMVVSILGLIASVLVLCNRLIIRWPWSELLGNDDGVCIAATVTAVAQSAILLGAVREGLGERSDLIGGKVVVVQKLIYTSSILFVLALCLGKLAVACLLSRLSPRRAATAITCAILLYGLAGILTIALYRDISQPWMVTATSSRSTLATWAAVEAAGMALDIVLVAYSASLVGDLNIRRSTRFSVFLGFALRFPVIIFAALRLAAMATIDYQDMTFSIVNTEVYGQVEMHYNLVAATIPCLRIFLQGWNTSFNSTTLKEMDPEACTVHSSLSPAHTPPLLLLRPSKHSRSSHSKRLSWRSRRADMDEIFDGITHKTESTISSDRHAIHPQTCHGSKYPITVQYSIDIEIK